MAPPGTDSFGDMSAAEDFADIARALADEGDVEATLSRICTLAATHIDGCEHAAVSLVERRRITSRGATSDVPGQVDQVQYETGEGPCLDAIREKEFYETSDLAVDSRWPRFADLAVERTGIRSMMSFRLFASEETLGALNLYSCQPGAFDDSSAAEWGSVFAAHAAVSLRSAMTAEQLQQGMDSRATIGIAVGLLMARQGIEQSQAFDVLIRASQRLNKKLREVATEVAGGDLSNIELPRDD